ncbi:MAG: ABC transporter permease subunit [Akkermansiaceae bacterium]|nr:ABC transporter permease subunit [Akkermansiaceae bacterium]NNM30280.1 ABC transporter permease subunit [Akkermansiaceae bacterium]
MIFKAAGMILTIGALAAGAGEVLGLNLPTLKWGFEMSRNADWLSIGAAGSEDAFPWFGWLTTLVAFLLGVYLLVRFWKRGSMSPITERKIERFKAIKRGYWSFLVLLFLGVLASLDQALVGSEALAVKHGEAWTFPAFTREVEKGFLFGIAGEDADAPPDYRALRREFRDADAGDRVIMPLWPYSPTNDNIPAVAAPLTVKDGRLLDGGKPYSGLAATVYDLTQPEKMHIRYRYRQGLKDGAANGWDREQNRVYGAKYKAGEIVPGSVTWNGAGSVAAYLNQDVSELVRVNFPPAPPILASTPRHPLGTNSQGYDVISYLYGGLKVNFHAALIYIPIVYAVGVSIGLLMGFFGGTFDLVVQRLIEILSNIPFLFLVIIVSDAVPAVWKDRFGLYVILGILAIFGWMGMTYLMRTSALKEKARDYIAATRVLGATTPRILFKHLLPNSVAIVVTLIPFSVSGLIFSLTALDYLGFGLPPKYATWGKLMKDGLDNLSSPWLVTSAFCALTGLLILVTFVGEAVREAFDPKKYTYYR